tara:strand:- start:39 stop:302 length:264 start_codon:yes stop_codon:yes gene_type:complete
VKSKKECMCDRSGKPWLSASAVKIDDAVMNGRKYPICKNACVIAAEVREPPLPPQNEQNAHKHSPLAAILPALKCHPFPPTTSGKPT